MAGILADGGLERKMTDVKASANSTKYKLHLFKSNTTPTTATVLGDFTECDFAGYSSQDISNWSTPSTTSHVTTITGDPNTFTRSTTGTAQNVYGYYVTDAASSILYFSERDSAAPRVLTNAGDTYTVTPKITDQSA